MTKRSSVLTIVQLQQMLERTQAELDKLRSQRSEAQRRVEDLDRRISQLGGSSKLGDTENNGSAAPRAYQGKRGRAGGGKRVKNEKSLIQTLEEVIRAQKGPMQVSDIVDAVQASGYKSNSANFRGIVNQTLIKDKRFASAGRGLYEMKR